MRNNVGGKSRRSVAVRRPFVHYLRTCARSRAMLDSIRELDARARARFSRNNLLVHRRIADSVFLSRGRDSRKYVPFDCIEEEYLVNGRLIVGDVGQWPLSVALGEVRVIVRSTRSSHRDV